MLVLKSESNNYLKPKFNVNRPEQVSIPGLCMKVKRRNYAFKNKTKNIDISY